MQGTWALTVRSLRQDSRLTRYHLLWFAVAGLLVMSVYFLSESDLRGESPGRDLLSAMAFTNLFGVSIVGVFLFAPTITEEKEEQTLGLLRMTRIGPSALLLGKTLPKLVLISLVLIVQLPLVFLTRTLGGVDWPLITNVYLLIFCQLIGVVSISMISSVVMRTSAGAVVLSGLLTFFCFFVAAIIDDIQRSPPSDTWFPELVVPAIRFLAPLNPIIQMDIILRSGANVSGTLQTCLAVLFTSAACYLFGVWTFSYWNQQESTQTELELLREWVSRLWLRLIGRTGHRPATAKPAAEIQLPEAPITTPEVTSTEVQIETSRSRRSHNCWQHAIAWKDFFLVGGGRTGLRTRCGIALIYVLYSLLLVLPDLWHSLWLGTLTYTPLADLVQMCGWSIAYTSLWLFGLDIAFITVNLFSRELKQQTWESLILLPQSLGAICRQKIWGAAVHLLPWTVSFVLGLALATTWDDVGTFIGDADQSLLIAGATILHVTSMLTTLLLLLTWLSLRLNPWVSILITWFVYVGVFILYMTTFLMAYGFMSRPRPVELQVLHHVCWITLGMVSAFLLFRSIRSTLQGEASAI